MTSDDLSSRSLGGGREGGGRDKSPLLYTFLFLFFARFISLSFCYHFGIHGYAHTYRHRGQLCPRFRSCLRNPRRTLFIFSLSIFHSLLFLVFNQRFHLYCFLFGFGVYFPFSSLVWSDLVRGCGESFPATPRTRRLPHEVLLASLAPGVLAASPGGAVPSPRPVEEPRGPAAGGGGAGRGLRSAALARSSSSSVARPQ